MFGKKSTTSNTTTSNNTSTTNKKYKPYRNRPSRRQACLEILSFLLLLAAVPAFLGGVFAVFISYFTLALGLIGLFAWTRRHAFLYMILAACVIGGCVVNIILRATFTAQCMPFFRYSGMFDNQGLYNAAANPHSGDSDHYNNSIWCGNREVVYITHAIILLLAIPAFFIAFMMLFKRKETANPTGVTQTTTTSETKAYATA